MLSRAPRLPQQKTTSNLGPGCYQPENHALITGKILGHDAYAPFSSLEKRTSAFDSFITNTPAPGNYDIEGLGFDYSKAPKFGKGTDRFNVVLNDSPGPNAYNIPETLKKKTVKKNINSFRLNPLLNVIDKVVEDMSRVSLDNIPEEETDAVSVSDIRGISALTKAPSIPPKRQKIIWKRKYIPPSIPRGDTAFGYQEGSSGELIPRQKPAQESYESLNYVSSFAERAIHDKKGYGFGKGTRIEPKIDSTPGPSHYQVVDKPSETGNRAAVLALSPCTRITDLEIKQELKRAIPGPGYFNLI